MSNVSLEVFLIVGAITALAGLGAVLYAFMEWGNVGFGRADPRVFMRILIPATCLIAVGVQLALTGFITSVLSLKLTHR